VKRGHNALGKIAGGREHERRQRTERALLDDLSARRIVEKTEDENQDIGEEDPKRGEIRLAHKQSRGRLRLPHENKPRLRPKPRSRSERKIGARLRPTAKAKTDRNQRQDLREQKSKMDLEQRNVRHMTRDKTIFFIEIKTRDTRSTEVTTLLPLFDYWNKKI
jgi:hypothetical protein